MERKILSICVVILMLGVAISGLASTNWIKSVEVQFHENEWVEYVDENWEIQSNFEDDMDAYWWNGTLDSNYGYSINKEKTNRGLNFFISQANDTGFGTIFSYVSNSDFNIIGVNPNTGAVSVVNLDANTETSEVLFEGYSVDPFDETTPMATKTIYNRYTGHLQYKIWPFMSDEPRNWTLDITNDTLKRSQSTQWGLYAEGGIDDSNLFAVFATQELPYDMENNVPTITAPKIGDDVADVIGPESDSEMGILEESNVWNTLDLQVLQVYPVSDHLDDNVYIFSGWNEDEHVLGFVIWVCADDSNETTPSWDSDYVYATFDVDHDHEFSDGDKRVYFSANESTGKNCWTYDGDSWVSDTDESWADVNTVFSGYNIQMMREFRQWYILVDLEEIIGDEDDVDEFIENNDEIGIQLHGYGTLAPGWAWSSWDRTDNTSIDYLDAITDAENFGDLKLSTDTDNPDYIDLVGSTMFSEDETDDVIQYKSSARRAPRWAISSQMMIDEELEKIKVPDKVNKSYFGAFKDSVSVEEWKIFSVNTTGKIEKTEITYTVDGDFLVIDVPDDSDAIVVVPDPSFLDTNGYMYNWLYGEYAIKVSN
jgi:hypothetical protein